MKLTPIVQCDNTLTHRAHMINGANGREACPGIETDKIRITQDIADLWYRVASHEDGNVSWGQGAFYAGLKRTLIEAIADTYPDVTKPDMIYELLIDSGEPVADCVGYWRRENERHTWCHQSNDVEQIDDHVYRCHLHGVTVADQYHVHHHDTEVSTSKCASGCKIYRCACGDEELIHNLTYGSDHRMPMPLEIPA